MFKIPFRQSSDSIRKRKIFHHSFCSHYTVYPMGTLKSIRSGIPDFGKRLFLY